MGHLWVALFLRRAPYELLPLWCSAHNMFPLAIDHYYYYCDIWIMAHHLTNQLLNPIGSDLIQITRAESRFGRMLH